MIKLFLFSILQFLTVALLNQLFKNSASLLAQIVMLFFLGVVFVRLTGNFEKAKQSSLFATILVIVYWGFKILHVKDIDIVFYSLANCFLSVLSLSFFVLPSFLNLQKLKLLLLYSISIFAGVIIIRGDLPIRGEPHGFFVSMIFSLLTLVMVWTYPFLITWIIVKFSKVKVLPHEFWIIGFTSYSLAWIIEKIIHPFALSARAAYIEPGEEIVIGGMMIYIPFTLMYFLSLYWGSETLEEVQN